MYFNVGIYNVEQGPIKVVYFNVSMKNVREHGNNVVLFNGKLPNVVQRRNNVVEMIISKKNQKLWFQIEYSEFKLLPAVS